MSEQPTFTPLGQTPPNRSMLEEDYVPAADNFAAWMPVIADEMGLALTWTAEQLTLIVQERQQVISAAEGAAESASGAASSASTASDAASTATSKASEASGSASSAASSASTASGAANTSTTKASEAATSATEAQEYRDQAQAISVGDVAITDLQPGALLAPKDYVSVDQNGALVTRNLSDDVSEQLQSGGESLSASSYDLAGGDPGTTTLDLEDQQVFELTNPTSLAIDFINLPAVDRSKPIIVDIEGAGSVSFSFPGYTVRWVNGGADNTPATPGDFWTRWMFLFTGTRLSGDNVKG